MAALHDGVKRSFATAAADWGEDDRHDSGRQSWKTFSREFNASPIEAGKRHVQVGESSPLGVMSRAVPAELSTTRIFDPDASVVLTGIPGSGKSTLAVIASTAMKRRVVDAEKVFQERSGLSSAMYKKVHGGKTYSRLQSDVLIEILQRHRKNSVIVCSWMERNVQARLAEFSTSGPLVYIMRDSKAIKNYLRIWNDSRVQDLLNTSGLFFRRCTHFEFFNITEEPSPCNAQTTLHSTNGCCSEPEQRATAPYLTLKRAERHFLKFLSLVFPHGAIPFAETAFPLASLPTEKRDFTYALSVRLSTLLATDLDIEELEAGADAIEIVVDDLVRNPSSQRNGEDLEPHIASEISRVMGRVRRSTVVPIFYHVILPDPLPKTSRYLFYVLHGMRLVPEYVSIDLRLDDADIAHIRSIKGHCKLVGHIACTDASPPPWTADVWPSYYRKAQRLGCNLVRFTRRVEQFTDNFEVCHVQRAVEALGEPRIPLIAYNTGIAGRHSACFNHVLTSVGYEGLHPDMKNANKRETEKGSERENTSENTYPVGEDPYPPPALTAWDATRAQFASFMYEPKAFYIFGASVSYSLSPAMHNAAFAACGMPHHYQPFSTDSIQGLQKFVDHPGFGGASVGLPFKVEVISLTDALSRHARAIGAVNTLIPIRRLNPDGSVPDDFLATHTRDQSQPVRALYGENTDWVGIRACLRLGLSPANAVRAASCGLVIGAGGMARAAVYAMLQLGVKNIVIFNRTAANADRLVEHFTRLLARQDFALLSAQQEGAETTFRVLRSRQDPWPQDLRQPTMIVSCIPTHSIGDCPAPDFTLPPPWMQSPTGGVVVELAYKTLSTPLLEQSRSQAERGWVTMDGLDLLPEQGFAQFELFTGRRAPRRLMRRAVFKSYPDDQGRSSLPQLQQRLDNIVEQEP